ncbi:hypothetical protein UP10_36705 [Bradyrhizobium sp. LTSPM299]|jgi:Family of unknown function (DUF5413)|uniref:DUF5413 family protein n=1 Tax=Bradyrhizobium sp. LTSPM299 TaxID=1619233 RepID=UPI0005E7607D|nr:DUF5413 family protein [Bradyrhizobium sp. LTSPM299]KJC55930.1 hypothetical protein UP10_36705 [Bradyrhizobium sp. LTSPM299]
MKRFLMFVVVGPAVGFAVSYALEATLGRNGGTEGFILKLPLAYMFGLLPSLVMWLEDWLLFDKIRPWLKIVTSAVVGYAASIAMLLIWTPVPSSLRTVLIFGIVGAVQAAVSSWLANYKANAKTVS